ncbi:hypothetical protein B7486_49705 [cyanobacterium TDX16]|nr:hypothetical protein B7486_49705 [cyanobacterium TDX16]
MRSWTGWHRHVTLVLAAGAIFVCAALSSRIAWRTLNSSIFFFLTSGLALWLHSKWPVDSCPAQSQRNEAVALAVFILPLLVCTNLSCIGLFGADIIKLWLATIITVNAPKLPKIIYNCSGLVVL